MPSRASPTEKIRGEIDALFGSGRELSEVLEDVARLGARLIMQAAAGPSPAAAGHLRRRRRAGRRADRQRARSLRQAEVKAAYWAIFDVPADVAPAEKAESLVQQRSRPSPPPTARRTQPRCAPCWPTVKP